MNLSLNVFFSFFSLNAAFYHPMCFALDAFSDGFQTSGLPHFSSIYTQECPVLLWSLDAHLGQLVQTDAISHTKCFVWRPLAAAHGCSEM